MGSCFDSLSIYVAIYDFSAVLKHILKKTFLCYIAGQKFDYSLITIGARPNKMEPIRI